MMKTALVVLSFVVIATAYKDLTQNDIKKIYGDVFQLFQRNDYEPIPDVNRLMFHDCAGDASCNGCINLVAGNEGLQGTVEFLDTLYLPKYTTVLSRADFWQIAGIVAINAAVELNNKASATNPRIPFTPQPKLNFRYGRKDCSTSPNSTNNDNLPLPTMSSATMFKWFWDNFRFNKQEVTALMGAHTLGAGHLENTGYDGLFMVNENLFFNNKYYGMMLDRNLKVVNQAMAPNSTTDKKFQFNYSDRSGKTVGFRLNTDIELVFNIDVSATAGTTCTFAGPKPPTCPVSDTISWVKLYASDPRAWINDFSKVYNRVIERGFEGTLKKAAP